MVSREFITVTLSYRTIGSIQLLNMRLQFLIPKQLCNNMYGQIEYLAGK